MGCVFLSATLFVNISWLETVIVVIVTVIVIVIVTVTIIVVSVPVALLVPALLATAVVGGVVGMGRVQAVLTQFNPSPLQLIVVESLIPRIVSVVISDFVQYVFDFAACKVVCLLILR